MYRRPDSYSDSIKLLRNHLQHTEAKAASKGLFGTFWRSGTLVINGPTEARLLKPLCASSAISCFLFKTMVPILCRYLAEFDVYEPKMLRALDHPSSVEHTREITQWFQSLLKSAHDAQKRADIDTEMRIICAEILAMFADNDVCEAVRILAVFDRTMRLVLRIAIPRMVSMLEKDTSLTKEAMDFSIVARLS